MSAPMSNLRERLEAQILEALPIAETHPHECACTTCQELTLAACEWLVLENEP